MAPCQLHHLNLRNGHTDKVDELSASEDAEAICIVQRMDRERALEL